MIKLVHRTQLHKGSQFLQSMNVLMGFYDMLVSGLLFLLSQDCADMVIDVFVPTLLYCL
jgi:hypothetical protein